MHDGYDEALEVEVDGDPEVHGAVRRDRPRVVGDGRVQERELAQRVDHGPGHERQCGQTLTAAGVVDRAVVGGLNHEGMRDGCLGGQECSRGSAPDVVEGHDDIASAGRLHVGARDPSAGTGPRTAECGRIDAQFGRTRPDRGRQESGALTLGAPAPRKRDGLGH